MDIGVRAADASVVNQLERTAHLLRPIHQHIQEHYLEDDSSASSAGCRRQHLAWHHITAREADNRGDSHSRIGAAMHLRTSKGIESRFAAFVEGLVRLQSFC
jgi:hypothetical protein